MADTEGGVMRVEHATEKAREILNTADVVVQYGDGWAGRGWYAWDREYPEEGSVRVDTTEPPHAW